MPTIPEGLTVKRDPSGKGLLASWWGVQIARVDSNPAVPGDLIVRQEAASSAFTHEGIGTLNGWLPFAAPHELMLALGELTITEEGTCWCGASIYRAGENNDWHHPDRAGHEASPQ